MTSVKRGVPGVCDCGEEGGAVLGYCILANVGRVGALVHALKCCAEMWAAVGTAARM